MNAITKPMLATKCECPAALRFPVLATPKLDGIRCLKLGGKALTRSFKPISNRFAREWIEANLPDGLDGELMLRGGTFNETTSAIGARDGRPDFVFHVFDYVTRCRLATPYRERMKALAALPESDRDRESAARGNPQRRRTRRLRGRVRRRRLRGRDGQDAQLPLQVRTVHRAGRLAAQDQAV